MKLTKFCDLEFEKVSFSWPNGVKVIDQCSFSIKKPGLWMLVGENGSGKSTLFRLISGLIRPESGKILCSLKPSLVSLVLHTGLKKEKTLPDRQSCLHRYSHYV